MKIIDTIVAGPFRMRLIERPAPRRYYFEVSHESSPHTGITFLETDKDCACVLFRGRVNRVIEHLRTVDHAGS